MNNTKVNQEERELESKAVDTPPVSRKRRALVYALLVAIVLIMLGYSLVLVLEEELTRDTSIRIIAFIYFCTVGLTSLACILYIFRTPYVSEFKRGWAVAIAIGALLNLSAFVLPVFWYLQVWTPFRGASFVSPAS